MLNQHHYLSTLTEVRACTKEIRNAMKSSRWKKSLHSKSLQRLLTHLCELMTPYAGPIFIRKMIEGNDPWLWLAGSAFIGIDPANHEAQLNALLNDVISEENYIDRTLFLEHLDRSIKSAHFQRIYKNHIRKEQLLSKSLHDYIKDLNTIYSKLMVIRLDLSYGEIYTADMEPENRVLSDWELFLKYAREAFEPSFIGYAVKFEYGADKGIHAHTLLFLDGSIVRQDTSIARHLGEHWKNTITLGAGIYFNANTAEYKMRMKHCAIGVFKRNDASFLLGVKEIAAYFAKGDPIVRMIVPGMTQTLRRSSPTIKGKEALYKQTSSANDDLLIPFTECLA